MKETKKAPSPWETPRPPKPKKPALESLTGGQSLEAFLPSEIQEDFNSLQKSLDNIDQLKIEELYKLPAMEATATFHSLLSDWTATEEFKRLPTDFQKNSETFSIKF